MTQNLPSLPCRLRRFGSDQFSFAFNLGIYPLRNFPKHRKFIILQTCRRMAQRRHKLACVAFVLGLLDCGRFAPMGGDFQDALNFREG